MKSTTVIASCLLGYAAAIPQGSIEKDAEWTLSNVAAGSTTFGPRLTSTYSLDIKTSHQTAHCNATSTETGAPLGKLQKTKCDPDAFAFSWTPLGNAGSNGYTIEVFDATTKQHATHHVTADQIKDRPWVVDNIHPHYYAGPTEFKVTTENDK